MRESVEQVRGSGSPMDPHAHASCGHMYKRYSTDLYQPPNTTMAKWWFGTASPAAHADLMGSVLCLVIECDDMTSTSVKRGQVL